MFFRNDIRAIWFSNTYMVAHAENLAKHKEVESIDIVAGDWELIVKIRTRNQDEYFKFLKNVISKEKGIENTNSIISLNQVKTEFVQLSPLAQHSRAC